MTSTALYRSLMEVIERRRLELGLSMERVNDLAGTQDGYYAKMIYPDTPSGRQARWETVDLVVQALFGAGFTVSVLLGNWQAPSALGAPVDLNENARKHRHWRHRQHFQALGAKGGRARASLPVKELSAIQRRIARKRERARREAKRKGEAHKAKNEAARDV